MTGLGGSLVSLGIMSFVLPMVGLQLKILNFFSPDTQHLIGGGMIGVGILIGLVGLAAEGAQAFE